MSGVADEEGDVGQGDLLDVLPAGTTLPGYELKSLLGHGAFGITYLARGLTLERDVAIKEYLPTNLAVRRGRTTVRPRSAAHAEQFAWGRERFLDEARTLARLDGTPAIVRVYDFLEANGTAYMVMALIEGENLNRRLMREVRLTPERASSAVLYPAARRPGGGPCHRLPAPRHQASQHHGRRPRPADPDRLRRGARRDGWSFDDDDGDLHAGLRGGRAVRLGRSSGRGPTSMGFPPRSITPSPARSRRVSIDRILNDTYEPLSELKPEGYAPELLAGIDAGLERHVGERPQSIVQWRHVLRTGERQASAQEATQVERKPAPTVPGGKPQPEGGHCPAWSGAVGRGGRGRGPAGWRRLSGVSPPAQPATRLRHGVAQFDDRATRAGARRAPQGRHVRGREAKGWRRRRGRRQKPTARPSGKPMPNSSRRGRRGRRPKRSWPSSRPASRHSDWAIRASAIRRRRGAARGRGSGAARGRGGTPQRVRQAEEDARKKVEADAEAKRQADEALAKAEAERQSAEQAARAKAEAEQAALRQSSQEAQRKAVEAESVRG